VKNYGAASPLMMKEFELVKANIFDKGFSQKTHPKLFTFHFSLFTHSHEKVFS